MEFGNNIILTNGHHVATPMEILMNIKKLQKNIDLHYFSMSLSIHDKGSEKYSEVMLWGGGGGGGGDT